MSFQITNLYSKFQLISEDYDFALEVIEGLSKDYKRLPSWLIFDDRGSELFQEITELGDYHPTICELEIFHKYKNKILELLPKEPINLIELGSGDGRKTIILLKYFLNDSREIYYYPIDISDGIIRNLVGILGKRLRNKTLRVNGLVAKYFHGLDWLTANDSKINFVLFLGSSIGNFNPHEVQRFLRKIWCSLNDGDYVMIGFDLMKNPKLLYRAYNDSKEIFQKFNLHLLNRINQELGANFDTSTFVQQGHYNVKSRAVESYLYSTRDQIVKMEKLGREFHFKMWEGIQTEHSYKFMIPEIEVFARNAGFKVIKHFFDSRRYFVDSVFKVSKES